MSTKELYAEIEDEHAARKAKCFSSLVMYRQPHRTLHQGVLGGATVPAFNVNECGKRFLEKVSMLQMVGNEGMGQLLGRVLRMAMDVKVYEPKGYGVDLIVPREWVGGEREIISLAPRRFGKSWGVASEWVADEFETEEEDTHNNN